MSERSVEFGSGHACFGHTCLPAHDRSYLLHAWDEEAAFARPQGPLCTNNADAMMPTLRAGLDLAVQPECRVWKDLAAGRLEAAMADWSRPRLP
jgi:DNA-binding transcriptional LysR family regulator